ncbi:tetratricopeptide repeat protein [Hymenobacter sp. B81]|uniref:tetratricopeptide repeat protein n=1 Tax=Hymenobacter sp. B81 TaxID=3344878 RepID=UPI0037DC44D5
MHPIRKAALLLAGLLGFSITCAAQMQVGGVPINELPRYGGARKTKAALKADQAFLADCDQRFPSRDSAARAMLAAGWQHLSQQQYPTAIKRFNQAWLLDSTNAGVYWGFGAWCGIQGRHDASVYFLERSRRAGIRDPSLLADLGNTLLRRYDELHVPTDLDRSIAYLKEFLDRATPNDQQAVSVYTNLSIAHYRKRDYAQAWTYVAKVEALAPGALAPGYLDALQQAYPRPAK